MFSAAAPRSTILPALEGAAGQVDEAEPQKGCDDERHHGASELPKLRRQKLFLLAPDLLTPLSRNVGATPGNGCIITSRGRGCR
jgi:hypothetical protein